MKNYILLIITIIFFASISRSQNKMGGESHTYTTNQAWQLALQFNPEKIYSTMNTHMSNIQDGVYLEDQNNIVYDYGFLCNLGHTATHFWDADAGDTQFFTFDLCLVNHECSYDNSYQKILRYWNGGYEIVLTKNFNPAVGCQGGSCGYGVWKIYL
jgi:hypothetical protein